jgi:hypothetical protein
MVAWSDNNGQAWTKVPANNEIAKEAEKKTAEFRADRRAKQTAEHAKVVEKIYQSVEDNANYKMV